STWSIRAPPRAKVAYTPQPSSTTLRALVVTDTRSASTVASGPSPCSAQAIASTGVNATSARQRSVPVVASSRTTRTSRPSDTSRGVQTPVSSHTAFRGGGPVRRARTTLPSGPGNTVSFSPSSAGRVRAAPSAPIATISRSPAGPCTQVSTSVVSVASYPAGAQVASSPTGTRHAISPDAGSTATTPSNPGGPSPGPPPSWATASYTVAGGSTSSPSMTTTCWSRPGATEAPLRSYGRDQVSSGGLESETTPTGEPAISSARRCSRSRSTAVRVTATARTAAPTRSQPRRDRRGSRGRRSALPAPASSAPGPSEPSSCAPSAPSSTRSKTTGSSCSGRGMAGAYPPRPDAPSAQADDAVLRDLRQVAVDALDLGVRRLLVDLPAHRPVAQVDRDEPQAGPRALRVGGHGQQQHVAVGVRAEDRRAHAAEHALQTDLLRVERPPLGPRAQVDRTQRTELVDDHCGPRRGDQQVARPEQPRRPERLPGVVLV